MNCNVRINAEKGDEKGCVPCQRWGVPKNNNTNVSHVIANKF